MSELLSRRHSIGVKIFGAFLAMSLITALLGAYGIFVLSAAGGIVADTYDRPLMAINFARAASVDFAQMDKQVLWRRTAPEAERAAVDAKIDELSGTFFEDLAVAEERSLGERESAQITRIRELVTRWNSLRQEQGAARRDGEIDRIADQVIGAFDTLSELTADQSFIERRKAVSAISYFHYASILLSGAAVLVGVFITLLLARTILQPLIAAAKVADLIAGGDFQTPIPVGGQDETGTLLRSMTVMQNNIREMVRREVAQRQSAQSRLIDALESSREGMVLVDAGGKIVLANRQVADFFPGLAAYVADGADFATAASIVRPQLILPENSGETVSSITERPSGSPTFAVREYQLLDGRWVRFSRSDTRDGGFFLSLIDFTDIKVREEHFKEAMIQADAANTAKSEFLTTMSHELRTPLNAIIGFSEIISAQMFGNVGNPRYLSYASDIVKSGRHLLDVINSVLDLAKSEASKLELRPEVFDLCDIIHDCAATMRNISERAQLQLDMPVPEQALEVYGEPAKLKQIILNLLSNAVKFNAPGGSVALRAGLGLPGMVEFRVIDTGIGMSASDIAVALTPFGQVDSRLARRYEGTGLGLPLTKALVDLHNGTMTIDSVPGLGTTITVMIPQPV